MPDELTQKQSQEAIALYTAYRAALDASGIDGRFLPYRWWSLPDPIGAIWIAYTQMLDDYASELANIINDLTHHVHRLRAWAQVVAPLSDEAKLAATHEFIDMLGTVALGLPYTIKSRFAYAAAHLCHQANMAKDLAGWVDNFPDKRALYLNDIEPMGRGWRRFRAFKRKVEPIAGAAFNAATDDFRNAYNHRFSARFVLGVTAMVSRETGGHGGPCYAIGGTQALDLGEVADRLAGERDLCFAAFDAFKALVGEQTAAIALFELDQARPSEGAGPARIEAS